MHLLLQYLVAKRIADDMTPQQRENARRVLAPMVAGQLVRGSFPGAHPVLTGALSQMVSQRLMGQQAQLTNDDLVRLAGNHVASTWVDQNFPDLNAAGRRQLTSAIVNARGW